jgi:WD40-like Beta Propeller Repeat
LPASYHFTVLILPVAIICGYLVKERRSALLILVIALYLAAGYPGWNTAPVDGWKALLHVKRLYALILLTTVALSLLRSGARVHQRIWWFTGAAVALTLSIVSGLKHQHGLFDDYLYRVPMGKQMFLAAQPVPQGSEIQTIALLRSGYRRATISDDTVRIRAADGANDELSLTTGGGQLWTEVVGVRSIIESSSGPSILDGESPATLAGGTELAFLRQIDGRKQLFVGGRQLTTPTSGWNLEEISISPNGSIVVAATKNRGESRLYTVRGVDQLEIIPVGEARYPAISPDGRWLAFSTFQSGYWNLSLRNSSTSEVRRLTTVGCNQTQPAWLPDSKTLLYSSDCGRALAFPAICKRRFFF